jgi:HTH-like domain
MRTGPGLGSSRSAKCSPCTVARSPVRVLRSEKRPPCQRAIRDEIVLEHIVRVHTARRIGRGLYGSRKVWNQLRKEQQRGEHVELGMVPRCQIERLMRTHCLRGKRRGQQFITTRSNDTASRPPDLVKRPSLRHDQTNYGLSISLMCRRGLGWRSQRS